VATCTSKKQAVTGIIERSAWAVPVHTMSGRFTEMLSRGLVERTGAKRPTRSGSMASVLMLTAAGLAALQSAGRRSDPGGHAP